MKKIFVILLMLVAFTASGQLKTSEDTLKVTVTSKTISLTQDFPYVTVCIKNTSATADTVRAYNVYRSRDTSEILAVSLADSSGTKSKLMIVPAKTTVNFFLWDPIIDYLLLRKNSATDKTLIVATRAKNF